VKRSLDEWLTLLETRHPKAIDLGLERVAQAFSRLGLGDGLPPAIVVAGTNGKGTVCHAIDVIARNHGLKVGLYTSPHLICYNERVVIHGVPVSDASLCAAFCAVDQVCTEELSLSYFEFGTLAALWLFAQAHLDLMVLEVGMGGRLDAVNIIDAQVSVLTSIALDHTAYLGPDRNSIGFEKAGILRFGRPCVCAEPDLPESVLKVLDELHCPLYQWGKEFRTAPLTNDSAYFDCQIHTEEGDLGLHGLYSGSLLARNLASGLQALQCMGVRLIETAVKQALLHLMLPGRQQILSQQPLIMVDVAHNPESTASLAGKLMTLPNSGRTFAVVGAMADKDIATMLGLLLPCIDTWWVADLSEMTDRAMPGKELALILERSGADVAGIGREVASIIASARSALTTRDRLIVWGSFYLAGVALPILGAHQ
jgi:dihydrofolate synthase/folylpolyglutamate synthase